MGLPWQEFKKLEPELASLGEERFQRSGFALLATLRKNGWPRISPVELLFFEGNIHLGMMWRSRKALDLRRDSKWALHNPVSNRDGTEGDFKVYGRAKEIFDLNHRSRYADTLFLQIGFRPEEPAFHLFTIQVDSVAFVQIQDGAMHHRVWTMPVTGVEP